MYTLNVEKEIKKTKKQKKRTYGKHLLFKSIANTPRKIENFDF